MIKFRLPHSLGRLSRLEHLLTRLKPTHPHLNNYFWKKKKTILSTLMKGYEFSLTIY